MFTSFAQLASTLEASLSLDALQVPADGTKKSDDNSTITKKMEAAKDEKTSAPNPRGADETEILLVEEVSRLSELLRSKNEECSTTMSKLSESLGNLQSQKLAFSDLSDELKALKVSTKLSSQDYDDKLSSAEREMCDLRDEVSRLKKVVDDGNQQRDSMQMQLSASPIVDTPDGGENNETEQNSQLHRENTSLKREISQNSISLSQAKQQISSLEGLLEEAKTSRRLNEDKLSKYERDLTSLTERLSTAESDRLSEVASYERKLKDMAEAESLLKSTHENNLTAITLAKSEADSALLQQKASYDTLNESFEKLNTANLEKISEMEDLYRSVAGASDSVEQEKSLRNKAQTELSNLREQLEEKSKSISELQSNLAQKDSSIEALDKELSLKNSAIAELQAKQVTLTEKTKDIVKKYSEIKAKNQSLELASGDKSAEALQQLQNKDSEVLSVRMKLENTERALGDQRAMAGELAERYGEAQRELSRAKAAIQEHVLTISSQQQDLDSKSHAITQSLKDRAAVESKAEAMRGTLRALEAEILDLRGERNAMLEQLRSDGDSAKVLDEYKKRAQLALKKSNNATAAANAEVDSMQRIVTETQQRLAEVEEAHALTASRCEELEKELLAVNERIKKLELERDDALQTAKASALAALQASDRVHELTALQSSTSASGNAQVTIPPIAYPSYKGEASSDTKGERGKISPGSVLTKSEGSDDDIVVVPSAGAGLRDDSEMSSYGSSQISSLEPKVIGKSAASNRRVLVQGASSSSSSSSSTNSEEGGKEDIDFARIGSDEQNKAPSSDQLYYVNELYSQMDELKREVQHRGAEVELTRQELQATVDIKRALEGRVEELLSYLDRSKKFQGDGPDSATNTEYLKNCVYRFMASTQHSEKKRLAPVICTILKLTGQEKRHVDFALTQGEPEEGMGFASIGAFAGSFFGATPSTNTST